MCDLDRPKALPDYELLFDPQSASGLLAGDVQGRAAGCVTAQYAPGYAGQQ